MENTAPTISNIKSPIYFQSMAQPTYTVGFCIFALNISVMKLVVKRSVRCTHLVMNCASLLIWNLCLVLFNILHFFLTKKKGQRCGYDFDGIKLL